MPCRLRRAAVRPENKLTDLPLRLLPLLHSKSTFHVTKPLIGHELCCIVHLYSKKHKGPAKVKPKHLFRVMGNFSHFGQTSRFSYFEHWPTFGHILGFKKYSNGKLAAPTSNPAGLSTPTVN